MAAATGSSDGPRAFPEVFNPAGLRPAKTTVSTLSGVEVFVVGAAAGAGAKTLTAPLDRIRMIYQVSPSVPYTLRGACRLAFDIAEQAGAEGLWRGHSATLLRVAPYAGVQFYSYDQMRLRLHKHFGAPSRDSCQRPIDSALAALCSGTVAASSATLVTYPLDVLRVRLVVQMGEVKYRNYLAAVEHVLVNEGPRGFYRGLSPTLLGVLPYGALSFGTFEVLQQVLRMIHGTESADQVPVVQRLAAGTLGCAFAQVAVYPLHVVRRRMQFAGPIANKDIAEIGLRVFTALDKDRSGDLCRTEVETLAKRMGVNADELWRKLDKDRSGRVDFSEFEEQWRTRQILKKIRVTEGISGGLFKGASLTWVKGPISVGLALVLNELGHTFLRRHRATHEGDQYAPLPGQGQNAQVDTSLTAVESLVCGAIAGSCAKTVIAPGDRVKILYQTDKTRKFTIRNAWRTGASIFKADGALALWRGHSATLLRVMPYSATAFATFDPYKRYVHKALPDGTSDVTIRFFAGAMAGSTATALTYPLDVFRARMAAREGKTAAYDGYLRAVRETVRSEGLGALWSGMRPTLLGIMPYSGLSFCIFETLKKEVETKKRQEGGDGKLRSHERLSCGAFAGLTAQSLTYPLDIVRRRMQVDPHEYPNEAAVVRKVLAAEGWRGLFKGLSMNWVKGPLSISISFFVNDTLRDTLAQEKKLA